MRKQMVEISLWEKGDRVFTFEGTGTVSEDEIFDGDVYCRGEVKVLLDESTSRFTNRLGRFDADSLMAE